MKKVFIFTVLIAAMIATPVAFAETVDELLIVGTGSSASLLEAVARTFGAQYQGIVVKIPPSIGSGGGIKAVGEDEYLVARVARNIQKKEERYGLFQMPIAKIPIVFFVNTSATIKELTPEQACGIFSGSIKKWEEIGTGKGKIRVIKREDGDSSLMVLHNQFPGFKEITLTPNSKTTYTDQETVVSCKDQPNSISFGSFPDVMNENRLRALVIGGMHPTNPSYPYVGVLSLVYKEKNNKGALSKFIQFLSTDAAKKAIIESGGFPVE
ncbi:MAG: substrate-binding domain-containing protein [Proteobacteria bacterium]|nr:substrate-binding domain-containing protein [Pseudomonadota bacterium]